MVHLVLTLYISMCRRGIKISEEVRIECVARPSSSITSANLISAYQAVVQQLQPLSIILAGSSDVSGMLLILDV